jgi:NACHT domain
VGDYAHASLSRSVIAEFPERPCQVHLHSYIKKELEAFAKNDFYGRLEERSRLRRQILAEDCRLLAVLGAAGICKTSLVRKLTVEVAPAFECIVWRSLHHAPTLAETLVDLLQSLRAQLGGESEWPMALATTSGLITDVLRQLQQRRCLLILDGVEAILDQRSLAGYYCEGYEQYGEVFRAIAESCHLSCLIVASQETPWGLKRLENQFVHVLHLPGLTTAASQQLLKSQGTFAHRSSETKRLVDYYAGNPLLLKLVAAQILDYFNGDISTYLNAIAPGQELLQDVWDVLAQQLSRASQPEQVVLRHLALAGEWVTLSTLQKELNEVMSRQELLDVLDSLYRRSLGQKKGTAFKISAAMAEFIQTAKTTHRDQQMSH